MTHEPLHKFIPEILSGLSKLQLGVIATTVTVVTFTIVAATLPSGVIVTVAMLLVYFCGILGILGIGPVRRWLRGYDDAD